MVELLGVAVNGSIAISEDRKMIGFNFDMQPFENQSLKYNSIEFAIPFENAMALLKQLQEVQKIFDIPMPEGTIALNRKK